MDEENPDYYARLANFRKKSNGKVETDNRIYRKLAIEINNPDFFRSKILTLHLYVEYWLDKIIKELGIKQKNVKTFHKKRRS